MTRWWKRRGGTFRYDHNALLENATEQARLLTAHLPSSLKAMSIKESTPVERQPGSADPQIRRLAEELYRERVAEAREMPPEEKLLVGEELFEYACSITLAGIRNENPGLSEADYLRILEERLDLRERMEKRG